MASKQKNKPKNAPWVSRETWKYIRYGCYGILIAIVAFISIRGAMEDASINEDVSAFNGLLEEMHDIKSPEDIMHRYYKFVRKDSVTDYIMTVEKQPRNRFMIVTVRGNLRDDSMAEEKFRMLVEDEKNHWKVVMVERNWRCVEGRGDTGWGIDKCN